MGLHWPRSKVPVALVASLTILLCPSDQPLAQPVLFEVYTSMASDTLFQGSTERVFFRVDPNGAQLAALTIPLLISYSNGNLIGPIREDLELFLYEDNCLPCPPVQSTGTDPDTLLFGFLDFGGMLPETPWVMAYIEFAPTDTGTITIDTVFVPPANHLTALDTEAVEMPVVWSPITIHVIEPPCIVEIMGDANCSGSVTSADIITVVGTIFKDPRFSCYARADVNCDGVLTTADAILMVNFVFKEGPPFCDVCPLMEDGTWECEWWWCEASTAWSCSSPS